MKYKTKKEKCEGSQLRIGMEKDFLVIEPHIILFIIFFKHF